MIAYVKNSKESTKNFIQRISLAVTGHKINILKLTTFLYTSNEKLKPEKKIKLIPISTKKNYLDKI